VGFCWLCWLMHAGIRAASWQGHPAQSQCEAPGHDANHLEGRLHPCHRRVRIHRVVSTGTRTVLSAVDPGKSISPPHIVVSSRLGEHLDRADEPSHTALAFLNAGYRVRGTVRSEAKGEYLAKLFADKGESGFDYVLVDDITKVRRVRIPHATAGPMEHVTPIGLLLRTAVPLEGIGDRHGCRQVMSSGLTSL
jgi:hypothetical protein